MKRCALLTLFFLTTLSATPGFCQIADDAVIRQAMEFAASALKLKADAVPDISKVRDWSYARAATAK
jgi:predicted NAD/FAD-dependent oxidoreductase